MGHSNKQQICTAFKTSRHGSVCSCQRRAGEILCDNPLKNTRRPRLGKLGQQTIFFCRLANAANAESCNIQLYMYNMNEMNM